MKSADEPERYGDDEVARRRDDVIRHMLGKPPQPRTAKAKERPASKRRVREGKARQ